MRILVAYDGSPSSEAAIDEVLMRPWPTGTRVRLVTVIAPQYSAEESGVADFALPLACWRASLREKAYARLQRALLRFRRRPDLEADYELREGSVVSALLCAIRESEADLVIGGSRGPSASANDPLGSVSDALLNFAPCNVEIVREPRRLNDPAVA